MLQPDERTLLLDGLRPPVGMRLDYAVGTTFSLDLEALLMAPVTFALFDAQISEGNGGTDPLSIIEAVRRHASNIDLFCQAGQIHLPKEYRPITAYLEQSVHACTAGLPYRIFHPKVWMLRFRSDVDVAYRLLVLSRNLTFSRSWDTIVRLEGELAEPDPRNEPLASFIRSLPSLRVDRTDQLDRVGELAHEIRSVRWTLPDNFDDYRFLAFGIDAEPGPTLPEYERILVMAPFASSPRLADLAAAGRRHVLVSRAATLDHVDSDTLALYSAIYCLSPIAAGTEDEESLPISEELAEGPGHDLAGLHAKLYIAELGSRATVVTGSPNATDAAFAGNTEFAVALSGHKHSVGINRLLTDDGQDTLTAMLEPYGRGSPAVELGEAEKAALRLEELGRALSAIGFIITVAAQDGDVFRLDLRSDRRVPNLGDATLRVWPVSRPAAAADLPAEMPVEAEFTGLSLQAITSFLCLELTQPWGAEHLVSRVVINARLTGAPDDRYQRILTAALRSKGGSAILFESVICVSCVIQLKI
jgi:hypothetical protein